MNEKAGRLILAVDPGTTKTAYVVYDKQTKALEEFGKIPNAAFLKKIVEGDFVKRPDYMAIEMMASQGMAVGQSTFETAVWIGRYVQAWLVCPANRAKLDPPPYEFVYRLDEKMHLCANARAKDPNIRQAIMDRYGSTQEAAVGKKHAPGPLYGVSSDVWAAIAIALVAAEVPEDRRCGHGGMQL